MCIRDREKLAAQVARLDALGPGRLDDFAEGGFVARDERDPAARRVSCAWRAAYAASGDRDQLALAEALDRGAPSGGAAQRLHGASTVEDGVLTLSGERDLERTVEGKTYHRIERSHGTFSRSFTLPEDSDAESVAAQFTNGVLAVRVAKREEALRKSIEVRVE